MVQTVQTHNRPAHEVDQHLPNTNRSLREVQKSSNRFGNTIGTSYVTHSIIRPINYSLNSKHIIELCFKQCTQSLKIGKELSKQGNIFINAIYPYFILLLLKLTIFMRHIYETFRHCALLLLQFSGLLCSSYSYCISKSIQQKKMVLSWFVFFIFASHQQCGWF